jgi:hypothetical protein
MAAIVFYAARESGASSSSATSFSIRLAYWVGCPAAPVGSVARLA